VPPHGGFSLEGNTLLLLNNTGNNYINEVMGKLKMADILTVGDCNKIAELIQRKTLITSLSNDEYYNKYLKWHKRKLMDYKYTL